MTQEAQIPSDDSFIQRVAVSSFWDKHDLRHFQPAPAVATQVGDAFNIALPLSSINGVYQTYMKGRDTTPPLRLYETTGAELIYQKKSVPDCPHGAFIKAGHAIENRDGTLKVAHWSTVELVVDWTKTDGPQQTERVRRLLSVFLKARPDLVVGQAVELGQDNCTFYFAEGGLGIVSTQVAYTDSEFVPLLVAFLHRSLVDNTAMLDPSTRRQYDESSNSCTFDVTLSEESQPVIYSGYRLRYSCSPFGRRTHIFVNMSNTVKLVNDCPARVIKDQWLRPHTKAIEKDILSHIHADARLPGVTYSPYSSVSDIGASRLRLRIVMDQCGDRFTRMSTVKQGLCLLYDLLEVTRFLYKTRGVLHRDISIGNVMTSSTHYEPKGDLEKATLSSLRFSAGLLDRSVSQWKTELLLIDFGCGEIVSEEETKEPFEPAGTPIFMARDLENRIVTGVPKDVLPTLPPPPPTYAELHSDRVADFPEPHDHMYSKALDIDPPAVDRHVLFYDAESVLWLLIYWLFFVQPAESNERYEHPPSEWRHISSDADDRHSYLARLILFRRRSRGLHPAFDNLRPLLTQLAMQTLYNPLVFEFPSDHAMNRPDYVHEAFQRHILAFIQNHNDAEFMNRPIRSWAIENLPTLTENDAQKSVIPSKRARAEPEPTPPGPKDDARNVNLDLPHPPPRKKSRLSRDAAV